MALRPIMEQTPWFVPWAIDFLTPKLEPHFRAFEWGSGWSTIWLAARCESVVSVESLEGWVDEGNKRIRQYGLTNAEIIYIRRGGDYKKYAEKILDYPDEHFHIISVDGRNRAVCIKHAIDKLTGGGMLVLDDSEREQYASGKVLMADWSHIEYWLDVRIDHPQGWGTTVWFKPKGG